ncbi:MAG: hypothetical protein D3904_12610 [Candidatus Electrothrix sp. EH2]|nr:hypothetical protein [Candidatus Electrothrix sp. EH2]
MRIRNTAVILSSLSLLLSLSACKETNNNKTSEIREEPVISIPEPVPEEQASPESEAAASEEEMLVDDFVINDKAVEITDKDFVCIRDMQAVRGMYIGNLLGNIDASIAVANSKQGGVYPPGTVIQLVPGEAMVKREPGFNSVTKDWEFFLLDVSEEGSAIISRGTENVKNAFGQDCLSCHAQAEPKWDMICETDHGCAPIPVTRDMIVALQKTDKRCAPMELTDTDKQALAELQELIAAFKARAAEESAETASPEEEEGEQ